MDCLNDPEHRRRILDALRFMVRREGEYLTALLNDPAAVEWQIAESYQKVRSYAASARELGGEEA